jgi:hypothetical protein
MATRNERIAEIEALFRAGNDRMMAWPENEERARRGETLTFLCECADSRCRKPVRLTAAQYEAVRGDPRRFLVAQGHEITEAEDRVVRKHEDVGDLVRRLNLRYPSADDDP